MSSRKHLKAFALADSGSALIEFSASATLMMIVFFGLIETGRGLYVANFVANGATEAIRYATVRGSTWNGKACASTQTNQCTATSADVANYLDSLAPQGVSTSSKYLTIATQWPGTTPTGASCSSAGVKNAPGCIVEVKVQYSFSFLFPFLPKGPLLISSNSAMVISQ